MTADSRNDPVFGRPAPLLFAHRGGAKEAPESIQKAFEHARAVRSDLLELDVNLTRDRKILVWHGPCLKNVRLEVQKDVVKKRSRKRIGQLPFPDAGGRRWNPAGANS